MLAKGVNLLLKELLFIRQYTHFYKKTKLVLKQFNFDIHLHYLEKDGDSESSRSSSIN